MLFVRGSRLSDPGTTRSLCTGLLKIRIAPVHCVILDLERGSRCVSDFWHCVPIFKSCKTQHRLKIARLILCKVNVPMFSLSCSVPYLCCSFRTATLEHSLWHTPFLKGKAIHGATLKGPFSAVSSTRRSVFKRRGENQASARN